MTPKLIEKVADSNNIKISDARIAVAVNDKNDWVENIIKYLSEDFKSVNIVTNNIRTFKALEEKLFEESGMAITVTNNKRRSLLKDDIILNIDFPGEILNRYSINENSIIISIEENVKIHKKRFNGKVICDYKIRLKPNSQISEDLNKIPYKCFDLKDLVECYIINAPNEIDNIIICK